MALHQDDSHLQSHCYENHKPSNHKWDFLLQMKIFHSDILERNESKIGIDNLLPSTSFVEIKKLKAKPYKN
jgi:hypothetical protein